MMAPSRLAPLADDVCMQDRVVADLGVARVEASGVGFGLASVEVMTLQQQHAEIGLAAHAALHMAEISWIFGDAYGTIGGAACECEKREQGQELFQRIAPFAISDEQ